MTPPKGGWVQSRSLPGAMGTTSRWLMNSAGGRLASLPCHLSSRLKSFTWRQQQGSRAACEACRVQRLHSEACAAGLQQVHHVLHLDGPCYVQHGHDMQHACMPAC